MPKYINPLVTGPGTGTVMDPWKDNSNVSWSSDNTFLLLEGTTSTVTLNPTSGGSAGAPKTIGTYQAQTGNILTGPGTNRARIDASGLSYGVYIGVTKTYVHVTDLEIFGDASTGYGAYKDITGTDPATVSGCRFYNLKITNLTKPAGTVAIRAYGADNEVDLCDIDDIAGDGIYMLGNRAKVTRNRTRRTASYGYASGDSIQLVGACAAFYVAGNDCEQLNDFKQCFNSNDAGAWGLIEDNLFTMNFASNPTSETHRPISIFGGGGPTHVRRNTLIGGTSALMLWADDSIAESNVVISRGVNPYPAVVLKGANCIGRYNTIIGDGGGLVGMNNSGVGTALGIEIYGNVISGFARNIQLYNDGVEYGNQLFDSPIPVANSSNVAQALGDGSTYSSSPLPASMIPAQFQYGPHPGYRLDRNGRLYPNLPPCGAYAQH